MLFYTYLWRDAEGLPFYAGKGIKRRAWDTSASRSVEFKAIYAQGGCTVEIVDEFVLESEAHAHEVELIEKYGRREFGGLLVNKTDGGEGTSGHAHSAEARAKMSEENRKRWEDAEFRAKQSAAQRKRYEDLAERAKQSAATRNLWRDPEFKAKQSAAQRKAKSTPEYYAKSSAAQRLAQPRSDNKSGFKGVSFHKRDGNWEAWIRIDGKNRYLGWFSTPEEAARAYDSNAIAAWGFGNCFLNFAEEAALGLAG